VTLDNHPPLQVGRFFLPMNLLNEPEGFHKFFAPNRRGVVFAS